MAGFGQTKEAQKAAQQEDLPAHEQVDAFEALQAELDAPPAQLNTHTFMGITGHENTTKTGIVTAAYDAYENA